MRAARTQQKGTTQIQSRSIPADAADAWHSRLEALQDEIDAVLADEKAEKALASAERDVKRGENMVVYEKEIMARPKRTWFESEKEKRIAKGRGRVELNGTKEVLKRKDGSAAAPAATAGAGANGIVKGHAGKGVDLNGEGELPAGGKSKKRKLSGKEKKRLDVRDEREAKRAWKKGASDRVSKGGKTGGGSGSSNGMKKGGKLSRKAKWRASQSAKRKAQS